MHNLRLPNICGCGSKLLRSKSIFTMEEYLQNNKSAFHIYREKYEPKVPRILSKTKLQAVLAGAKVLEPIAEIFPTLVAKGVHSVTFQQSATETTEIVNPLRIGCVLSGGQAAGGHNVIVGIYEYIKRRHPNSQLFGFLNGPHGIYSGKYIELTDSHISYFKNRGGFDMICSGRHKIETEEQFQKSLKYCESLKLDGLVVIGGDDSNTNAAHLAEYFLKNGSAVKVVGCPKTIDGDLKNEFVEVSFGFDTACKTYSECIGSVMVDTLSSQKYYHFIRLMGRSASHIALECALLTRPTYTFIGEQVQANKSTLKQLVEELVSIIVERAKAKKDYGVILVPEGLIEFIQEMNVLIKEINKTMADEGTKLAGLDGLELFKIVHSKLTESSQQLLSFLPKNISEQLLLDRDPHGNVQVAKIQTEKLIIDLVSEQLKSHPEYKGDFSPQSNYFGYEGRCAFPTNFDCDYCYSLGVNAGAIIETGHTGLMSCIRNLSNQPEEWLAGGYPLITMMDLEVRKGKNVAVITKALVDLNGPLFGLFRSERVKWARDDYFNSQGPIQFEFPSTSPFLAVPPTLETLYLNNGTSTNFDKGTAPYAKIYDYNMNTLTSELAKIRPECPPILNSTYQLLFSETLPFHNVEVAAYLQKNLELTSRVSNRYLEFRESSAGIPKKKTRIGVCFNGRQTPGGHNIISSLFDGDNCTVFGFVDGTQGLFKGHYIEIRESEFNNYRNQSGFHFLGRSSDKLRTSEERQKTLETCQNLDLDGLILVGATHTLNDALHLSEYFLVKKCKTKVVGLPASIDNTVYHNQLEVSVGFSSSSHLYSTLIANLMTDASSNTKYWYFIRLMGRDPSNLALECALATHPNLVIISEEVESLGWDIEQVVGECVRVITERESKGLGFGCIIIPEGLISRLPSINRIVKEMDNIKSDVEEEILKKLSPWSRSKYESLPEFIQKQLREKDNTNALAFSQIETEKMLAHMVGQSLKKLKQEGKYKGSFSSVCHFFGYQGRCAIPDEFDRNLAQTYGTISKILIENDLTGYCPTVKGVSGPITEWSPGAIPLVQMIDLKLQSTNNKIGMPVRMVHLKSGSFAHLVKNRRPWVLVDHYENPGPTQFFGRMKSNIPLTLSLNNQNTSELVKKIEGSLAQIRSLCRFGTDERQLNIAAISLDALIRTIQIYNQS